MGRRAVALGLIFAVLGTSTIAILFVSFQVKNQEFSFSQDVDSVATTNSEQRSSTGDSVNPTESISTNPGLDRQILSSNDVESEPEIVPLEHDEPNYTDNRIVRGEYAFSQDIESDFRIHWNINEITGMIYIALQTEGRGGGCLGIAFNPSGPQQIFGADIVSGYNDFGPNNEIITHVRDDSAREVTRHFSDSSLQAELEGEETESTVANILDWDGNTNQTGTVIEFSRMLVTGDSKYDHPIRRDRMPMLVLVGSSSERDYNCFEKSGNFVARRIDFFNGTVEELVSEESSS